MLPSTPQLLWTPPRNIVAATPFSIANTDFAFDTTSQTAYTFSGKSIGPADVSRLLVLVAFSRQAGSVGAASGIKVNGSAAASVVSALSTGTTSSIDMFQFLLAAGITANFEVDYPSAMARCALSVYSILGSNGSVPSGGAIATSVNNGSGISTPISATITVPSGGGSIIGAVASAASAPTFLPTNYTEDQDQSAATTLGVTTGHDTSGVFGSRAYTATQSIPANQPSGAFAAWGP